MINIKLKDGSSIEIENGKNILDLAMKISNRLGKEALAGKVNGEIVDLNVELKDGDEVSILTFDDEEGKDVLRHTSSHILAYAVKRLYGGVKLAIGPAIKDGFYYDFDMEHNIKSEDLEKIEGEMNKIIKENPQIRRFELDREKAIELMESKEEIYKVELINDLPKDAVISFYEIGDFVDLCAGPHLPNLKSLKAIKLLSSTGAYWRGSEKNKMLQRVYGTSFPKVSMLEEHLNMLEEAKKRDHRKLGKELELFMIPEEGPGFPMFLPKGMIIKEELIKYWREVHKRRGYVEIETPMILNRQLWETSGHWYHYKENMYSLKIDEEDYAIKPMNCPGGMLYYKSKMHSYKEFPLRVGELGKVHRHELSGALHGLMRVRVFTQDDAHIFMLPEQIKDEIKEVISLIDEVYKKFGFEYHLELSTRPEDSIGTEEEWKQAEKGLREALEELNMPYILNEGDGAFYGPKIDFHLKDCLGRTWQCGTIQLDMQLPQRFNLEYIGKDGEKHRPVMIHRVVFGSIERFMGILIEHFAGAFPTWLSPVQAKILPISDKYHGYAHRVKKDLERFDIRVEVDERAEKIGYKIREARNQRIPYILVVGENEEKQNMVSLRSRENGDEGLKEFKEIVERIN